MVSSLTTVRLWSQQAALNAFKEPSDGRVAERLSPASSSSSLADFLHTWTNDDDGYEDTSLSALIESMRRQAMGGTVAEAADQDGSIEDISSTAFMKALQDKIKILQANPDTREMAENMLKAIEAGTLKVTDTVAGEQIKAWDVSVDGKSASGKIATDQADWTSFLKEHLSRDSSGRYIRNPDSSHKDKADGVSSYFGMIGDTYYYLSWTAPSAEKPPVTIQI
jgi:hypothetical protein